MNPIELPELIVERLHIVYTLLVPVDRDGTLKLRRLDLIADEVIAPFTCTDLRRVC